MNDNSKSQKLAKNIIIEKIKKAALLVKNSSYIVAFTGAGISVESGIPPFRGKDGLWNTYNPRTLELDYFFNNPRESWELNKEVFYNFFQSAEPNRAHYVLAEMEERGLLKTVITQNIDNLHQQAGNTNVLEFHGSSRKLICIKCGCIITFKKEFLATLPPHCKKCGGILKPGYIFFGESIPEPARTLSFKEAEKSDLMLVIGTTGEVQPASLVPYTAAENGASIIEINTSPSSFTSNLTDIFLQGNATSILEKLSLMI